MAIRIIDTFSEIDFLFENGSFLMEKWVVYANAIYENFAPHLKKDTEGCLDGKEYTYEKTVLPVLNAVCGHPALEELHTSFVWQLFTEGIAMYFEQVLVGDSEYYHQNRDGWKEWCEERFRQIITDFHEDLPGMTRQTQRYFGDWVSYYGRGDVGYYLGTKFVHRLCERYRFAELIRLGIEDVYEEYLRFAKM